MTIRSSGGALCILAAALLCASPSRADRVSGAAIAVDAKPAGADVTFDLTWTAAAPRASVTVYLASALRVTSASVAGKDVQAAPEPVKGSGLTAWKLPAAVKAGESSIRLRAQAAPGSAPGLRVGEGGGQFLPGSGWFPRTTAAGTEIAAHTVSFTLPEGWSGIAAGTRGDDGTWTAPTGRPYAVWGPYDSRTETAEASDGSSRSFAVWRRAGDGKGQPALTNVADLLDALDVGLGEAEGAGDWKVVEADETAGGLRTLFWGGTPAENATLRERDVACALAASYWTESAAFRGDRAAFLSRALALQIGDISVSALSDEDDLTALEAVTIGSRRAAFVKAIAKDRPLHGLIDVAEGAGFTLATRGALVAHTLAEQWPSRSRWVFDLREFRKAHRGKEVDWDTFAELIFWKTKELIEPFLATTDLPDFRILSQSVQDTKLGGRRYAVEVENRGKVGSNLELATFDSRKDVIHSIKLFLEAGGLRIMKFADPENVARIEIEPRGVVPEADLTMERVDVEPLRPISDAELAARIPSFPFRQDPPARRAQGLNLDLDEVSITGFDGWVVPFSTHHGPSGACLLGSCTVTIRPKGDGAAAWKTAMDVEELKFPQARDLWIRFPVAAWDRIEPQLGEMVGQADRQKVLNLRNWVYNFSFQTGFFEGTEAQVPPAGSSLVVFRTGADQWEGYVRQPMPDATVLRRLWDHLASRTIWEDRR